MSIFISLSSFALRQLVEGACATPGVKEGSEAVVGFLAERFTDHSQRLARALQTASDNAWKALEIALAGDSLWDRCKAAVARAEDRAFARQVRAFLDATPLPELPGETEFRQKCLEELRAARKGRALTAGSLDPRQLAEGTASFARFSDPTSLLDAEWRSVVGLAGQVKEAGFPSLAWLLAQRPRQGTPVLVAGVRYFFRRAVEEDPKLFQGLSFAKLEALGEAQEKGFASLSAALAQRGERLEELLVGVQAVVVQTHSAVLDLQGQIKGQGEQIGQIGQAVMKLLEQHQLQRREVRPGDSLSIRNEGERQLVKQLVARYRSLPEGERQNVPSLLNAIGKLEVVAGDFNQAQKDFQQVATMVDDTKAKAEAHFNAYQAALERRDLDAALKEFIEAVKLDGKRYAPFPVGKYHPVRILGAGGFGTAFLCRHKYMNADVVVKALHPGALGRDTDKVFTEAQVLRQLDHPAVIRISECGYVDAAGRGRPHLIMDYFQGQTLEAHVKEHGPLPVEDLLAVARQVAEGLQAAHGGKVLHRDVKPANLLVRKEDTGWKVKIIDFGLAMAQKAVETSRKASTVRQQETMIGSSIAGTLDYGAPEQMGRRKEPVGPYSDVYGWAKTCCYALFQTTHPLMKHWKSVPEPLAELLEKCLEEDPRQRPAGFAEVLKGLDTGVVSSAPAPVVPEEGFGFESRAVAAPRVTTTRKKPRKSLLPWVLGGVGLLAVALVVVFGLVLGGAKKEGPRLVEPGNIAAPDQAGGKRANVDKNEQQPEGMPKEKDKPDKTKDTPKGKPEPNIIQEPPVGIWEEERSVVVGTTTEQRNRIREFRSDGTMTIRLVRTGKEESGTWRRQGDRIYFSHGSEAKWFTIQEADSFVMAILMGGDRRFVWRRIVPGTVGTGNAPPPPAAEKTHPSVTVGAEPTKPAASGAGPKVSAPQRKDDRAMLQGRWYAVSEGDWGKEAMIAMNKIMDVSGDRMRIERTFKGERGVYDGTFRLEPTGTPKWFDWEGTAVRSQRELHGIYELTEDTFKVCYMTVPKGATYTRPSDYSTPGNSRVSITFKRSPLGVGRGNTKPADQEKEKPLPVAKKEPGTEALPVLNRDTSDSGFFNGKNLDGWEGLTKYWSVKEGAIVGYTPEDPRHNTFLCSKKKYGDFEMKFKVRLKDGIGNSGVQIRSNVVDPEKFIVAGPQCDMGASFWGSLFGERFGGMMKQSPPDLVKQAVKQADFNDYAIKCVGKHVTIKINGETMVDDDFPKMPDEGIIAWQLHAGFNSMEVTFKDIEFKDLSNK
jgi:uncharacterized protein (TIGR03067 family)